MKDIILFLCCITSFVFAQNEGVCRGKDKAPIYYKTFGKGDPILIINGGPGFNSKGFEQVATQLSQHNQTILYDQRGTGQSKLDSLNSKTITMDLMVEDMERLRKHLKIKRWTLSGHSFGGMLAAYYTTKYPKRLKALIFSSSGGVDLGLLRYVSDSIDAKLSHSERQALTTAIQKINEGDTSFQTRLSKAEALAPAYVYHKEYAPKIAQRLTEGNAIITELVWADMERIPFDCKPTLSKLAIPTLILQGKNDIINQTTAETIYHTLKNSHLVLIENCAHYGWLDAKDVYFEAIDEFMVIQNGIR